MEDIFDLSKDSKKTVTDKSVENNTNNVSGNNSTSGNAISKDVNKPIEIADEETPIIILFGPGASGKTMTLIRLTKYLLTKNYKVEPESTFLPSDDGTYKNLCKKFPGMVNADKRPNRNDVFDFMLVTVRDERGRPICQILEAPGEHYFDVKAQTKKGFPNYINTIKESNNRKTWVFIVERGWENPTTRSNYANKIIDLQNDFVDIKKDKVIFTCHKADMHPKLINGGIPNKDQFFKDIKNQYSGIFSKFKNTNPISRFWREYNFDFVVFSAGIFNEDSDFYTKSNEKYPEALWASILKTIRGSIF